MENSIESQIREAPFMNLVRMGADIGNTIVLSPHPDDESLGCGGLIAHLREADVLVSVVFITSGAASHTSKTHPPSILSGMRELEAIRACSELGVHISNIHFLREQDSGLSQLGTDGFTALTRVVAELLRKESYATIALPWRRDPHPDHRVVYEIGKKAMDMAGAKLTLLEYPVWLWKNATVGDWPINGETSPYRLDIASVFQKKWRAIRCHRTQLGLIIEDDPNGFVLTDDLLEPFKLNTEYYFVTRRALGTLDKEYFHNLYAVQTDPWNFRNSAYELEKYRMSVASLGKDRFQSGLELGCSIGIQTKMLAAHCELLTAVDISEIAVREAKRNCAGISNLIFLVRDVTIDFPNGKFDLVTCCEIGYYMTTKDLDVLFKNISDALITNGKLLLVHWIPFVPDYPQSGDMVHDAFTRFASSCGLFKRVVEKRFENYRMDIWEKRSGESET